MIEIIEACVNKKLNSVNLEWHNEKSLCIVLCSKGYPEKFENNVEIKKLDKLNLIKINLFFTQEQKLMMKKLFLMEEGCSTLLLNRIILMNVGKMPSI